MKIPQRKDKVLPIGASGNVQGSVGSAGMEYRGLSQVGQAIGQGADVAANTSLAIQRIDNWKKESDAEIADLNGFSDYWNSVQSSPDYLKKATTLDKDGKSELELDYEKFQKTNAQNVLSNVTHPQSKMRIEQMLAQNNIGRVSRIIRPTSRELIVKDEIAKIPGKLDVFVRAGKTGEASAYLEGLAQRGVIDPIQRERFEGEIDELLQSQAENTVLGLARESYNSLKEKLGSNAAAKESRKHIENSGLPEDKKVERAKYFDYWVGVQEAEEKKAAYETELSENQKIVGYYGSNNIADLQAGYDYANAAQIEPENKKQWLDNFRTRIKAIKDGLEDPAAQYDPKTYIDFSRRAKNKKLTQIELDTALGKGVNGGISVPQYNQLSSEIKAEQQSPTNSKIFETYVDRLRNRIVRKKGMFESLDATDQAMAEMADDAEVEFRTQFEKGEWDTKDLDAAADAIITKYPSDSESLRRRQSWKGLKQAESKDEQRTQLLTQIKELKAKNDIEGAKRLAEQGLEMGVFSQAELDGKPEEKQGKKKTSAWKRIFDAVSN